MVDGMWKDRELGGEVKLQRCCCRIRLDQSRLGLAYMGLSSTGRAITNGDIEFENSCCQKHSLKVIFRSIVSNTFHSFFVVFLFSTTSIVRYFLLTSMQGTPAKSAEPLVY